MPLIIEEHLIATRLGLLQQSPFLFVLLILVAWQYRYRQVVLFTFSTALLDLGLTFFVPQSAVIGTLVIAESEMTVIGGLVARTASFLVLGYVLTRLVKAQRDQRTALSTANRKLVQHAAMLEQLTISRERNRISRELHDTLAHTLSALAVQQDAFGAVWDAMPEQARAMLNQMLDTTRSGLDETRRALRSLRAEPLEELGLALAVRTLAEDFAARETLALELEIPDHLDDLSPEVEQCYYRVAQEALENIARHAAASRFSIRIRQNGSGLLLMVSDDGQGFDPLKADSEEQYGIVGMRERAELIGARLRVDANQGLGTTVELVMENKR